MRRGARPAKAKVEAKLPAARKSRKNEGARVRDLEKRLAEALGQLQTRDRELVEAQEQQTATAEILRVISASPTDLQPVLDAVAESAARLCEAQDATIRLPDGDGLQARAHFGPIPSPPRIPMARSSVAGRAVIDRETVHVHDLQAPESEAEFPVGIVVGAGEQVRTLLATPLLREDAAIGVIVIRRTEVRPFSEKHIALLKTFADQAVIAIENVRLFNETKEALEQQTATAEILRVISSSPTDTQPVFDIIAANAARLCAARDAQVLRVEGDVLRLVSAYGSPSMPPVRAISRGHAVGRAVIDRQTIHVRDMAQAVAEFPETSSPQHGVESLLAVPLLREDVAVGVIRVSRTRIQPFTERQIALLQTFADQGVIAIENVRLFSELQASNRELTEALDRQTATSEILRVISGSRTDLQPVFDTILQSAVRLCGALNGFIWRVEDGLRRHVSYAGVMSPEWEAIARSTQFGPPTPESVSGWVMIQRKVLHVPDLEREEKFPRSREMARVMGYRSLVAVPMLRNQDLVGAIVLHKAEPFDEGQIQLLRTFSNQAVIAVENARLLGELQARTGELTRSVDELTALGEVSRALSSTLDLDAVLNTIVTRANQLAGTDGCTIYEYDETAEEFQLRASHYADEREAAVLDPIGRATPIPKGQGLAGRAALLRESVHIPDIAVEGAYESPVRGPLLQAGYRALLGVPLLREEQIIGVLGIIRKSPGEFAPGILRLLTTFATQSALAIQNARLFREIADKSRQLEAASRHKSEFLANMSHELRTPLNAIIGFSEVLTERMFGELNDKQEEYLKDIYASGQHLLSLINDILDLSKIEAGRMELELTDFDLPQAITNALTLVRGRAERRSIVLHQAVDERLGSTRGDERKIKQVLLNLLSNALKFTPEGGRVDVRASVVDAMAEVSVTDTGVGIAPEDQEAVFEEFRQVGTADKKVEGTGLGLTLSRKFIELHGGRIWVKSQVGVGSTFTFTLPLTI
jgi:signal transduction histidine kinase